MDDAPPGDLRAPPRRPMAAQPAGQQRIPRIRAPGMDGRNPNGGPTISRPTQVPQWPLAGPPLAATNQSESEPYRPPPGKPQQAPQRPPRPSQVPSMLDQSRLQDPTPVFLNPDADYYADSPTSPSSQTSSDLGELHDFPAPGNSNSIAQQRRSANLGPPPSSRRGASSFYSNPSYVSPIPEESLASKSHGSYASSAAMPDSWPIVSREASPTFYDESDIEKSQGSVYDDFNDESKLVRSASIGKRGKPALVTTKSSSSSAEKKAQSPVMPFGVGNGREDPQNSWIAMSTPNPPAADISRDTLSPDAILGAYAAASATDLAENRMKSPSPHPPPPQVLPQPPFNRLSAIRRPPRLDIDAVRSAEERGSITSLPDLIRRATRLASMIDRGRRPASRFGDLGDYYDEKAQVRGGEKENSGLSDMLNAFPPPAAQGDRQSRGSWFRTTSWPLAPSRQDGPSRSNLRNMTPPDEGGRQKRRRCCGLPMWGFIMLLILLLGVIAAAVFVPLEFFVFKNLVNKDNSSSALTQCQESLVCQNGGSNVISQGTCSCICTNGFTGSDCSSSGSEGCTTTDLVSSVDETTISNVTLGKAIPRLIANSNSNFSIPLSGTSVLAKFNSGDLSCIAQNSLVTFDGSSSRKGEASDKAESNSEKLVLDERAPSATAAAATTAITISPDSAATTLVLDEGSAPATKTGDSSQTTSAAADATATDASATPSATFTVTEEVLDFARVAVLYVLQEQTQDDAESAQTKLERFFSQANESSGVTEGKASSVDIGGDNSVDLVNYTLNIGSGSIGGKTKREAVDGLGLVGRGQVRSNARHGGSVIPNR
ncbi:hypothetical protein AK830_g7780 [Neonectria ditissima]|uniref:EGF-like domain-containing protein n=1 Tax=Neonectria ditissima TaxID=78410 RepID=A0A0P7BFK0_9HYPO|nr:hypothetical protein AK830_g7780 [Neonectria ditissima]